MQPFAVSRADDAAKAIAAHALDPELAFIAGGTDLIGLMKDRAVLPERLLDINGLPNMARIEALPGGGVRIGALARMSDVAADTRYVDASRSLPRHCCSAHPANCAIWRRSAATSCSGLAAHISATRPMVAAISDTRGRAVRHSTALIAITRFSDGLSPAWRRTRPILRSRWQL